MGKGPPPRERKTPNRTAAGRRQRWEGTATGLGTRRGLLWGLANVPPAEATGPSQPPRCAAATAPFRGHGVELGALSPTDELRKHGLRLMLPGGASRFPHMPGQAILLGLWVVPSGCDFFEELLIHGSSG